MSYLRALIKLNDTCISIKPICGSRLFSLPCLQNVVNITPAKKQKCLENFYKFGFYCYLVTLCCTFNHMHGFTIFCEQSYQTLGKIYKSWVQVCSHPNDHNFSMFRFHHKCVYLCKSGVIVFESHINLPASALSNFPWAGAYRKFYVCNVFM